MKLIVAALIVNLMVAGFSYGEPPTHQEVASKVRAVVNSLDILDIKGKDAALVAAMRNTLLWINAKLESDLSTQYNDAVSAKKIAESNLAKCQGVQEQTKE